MYHISCTLNHVGLRKGMITWPWSAACTSLARICVKAVQFLCAADDRSTLVSGICARYSQSQSAAKDCG